VSVRFTPTSPLARSTYTLTVTRYWATSTKSTLAPMTRTGLVKRTVTPTVPPQVSYSHTPLGADLTVQLWGLVSWIGNHTNDILEAQVRHDAATIHP
jgi:HxlR-like helix-turn-helix